ncbi:hypothetical protein [Streptomyces prunicolor]|uniref:hypothetical protein n=1 Tax=Streptomyces prunicolor TaxID=67348 RepID=UPI000371EE59|nr:hypothetical protein [Streptomyces prunicolor]
MPVGGLVAPATGHAADPVVRNAKIHTGDPVRLQAGAVAARDGVVMFVGDDNDVAAQVGPATQVVDALGRRLVSLSVPDRFLGALAGAGLLSRTELAPAPAPATHRLSETHAARIGPTRSAP